jgi:hypothetical protein
MAVISARGIRGLAQPQLSQLTCRIQANMLCSATRSEAPVFLASV